MTAAPRKLCVLLLCERPDWTSSSSSFGTEGVCFMLAKLTLPRSRATGFCGVVVTSVLVNTSIFFPTSTSASISALNAWFAPSTTSIGKGMLTETGVFTTLLAGEDVMEAESCGASDDVGEDIPSLNAGGEEVLLVDSWLAFLSFWPLRRLDLAEGFCDGALMGASMLGSTICSARALALNPTKGNGVTEVPLPASFLTFRGASAVVKLKLVLFFILP
jgi:hypothetical protein